MNDPINIANPIYKKVQVYLTPIAFNREVTGHIYRPWFEEEKTESQKLNVIVVVRIDRAN